MTVASFGNRSDQPTRVQGSDMNFPAGSGHILIHSVAVESRVW